MIKITVESFLADWAKRHIENKDIVFRKIVSIDKTSDGLHVKYSDRELDVLVVPFIRDSDALFKKLEGFAHYKTVVVFNNMQNIEILRKNWEKFVSFGSKLNFYFANPFSKTEKVWIICPYTHNFIADMESLELGLKTMSENVEYVVSEEEVKKIIES